MKLDVNYIKHHKNVNIKMMDDDLSPIHISLYNALFMLWNRYDFDTQLSINRNDVMKLSKIGSANTYTTALKKLDELGYIKYLPSFNPLKGSLITFIRFDKGSDKATNKSSDIGTNNSYDNAFDKGSDTFYKTIEQYNKLTIEQVQTILSFYSSLNENELIFELEKLKFLEEPIILDDLKEKKSELIKSICESYGFEERHMNQKRIVMAYINTMVKGEEDYIYFYDNSKAYADYKLLSQEKWHGFDGLFGTQQEQFLDGALQKVNWQKRLENHKLYEKPKTKFERTAQAYKEAFNPYE